MIVQEILAALLSVTLFAGGGTAPGPTNETSVGQGRFELHVPVVYYHHIACPPAGISSPGLWTCPAQFATQMKYVHDHGWRAITIDQLADLMAERQCPEPRTFVVSFDDGDLDQYANAAPILETLGMKGSFFVVPGDAGEQGVMTFGQMRDLVARGHAIGNHSLTHLSLPIQPADVLHEEVEGAQQLLAAELGFRPRTFAYPYGRYGKGTDRVINEVRNSGLELAFTVVRGAREASDLPLLSRRVRIAPSDTGAQALARLEPFVDGCPPPTADLAVGLSKTGPFKGGDVYASTAVNAQTIARTGVKPGQTYGYWARLQNDGQFADAFTISAGTTGPPAIVRFYIAGVDVTSQITNGTYTTGQREPWSSMLLKVSIRPGAGGSAGQAIAVVVRAAPLSMPARIDIGRVRAVY